VAVSPRGPHAATPHELRDRLRAEARGEPLLVYRDADDRQVLVHLADAGDRVVIGRGRAATISLTWDARASRVHASLERLGDTWTLADDGLSRNGTCVNGTRVTGRWRLHDGDVIVVGDTALVFVWREPESVAGATVSGDGGAGAQPLTPAQRRVLTALCRPYREGSFASPASNPDIARELIVSVEAVKTTMRSLFERFGIDDLPQNRKRAALAEQALRTGAVTRRDLEAD
jgi:pSer/pThr/pTyr-binding forkhead associated (FHA) protein